MAGTQGAATGGRSYRAWAKINLFLEVTGQRADGYHLLHSLVVFAGVGDRLQLEPAEDLSLAVDGPFAPALPNSNGNLILKAARALAERCGTDAGARISLTKNLPVAAGIGGGSADAATALEALLRLWDLSLPLDQFVDLTLGLGADLPVCLYGRPALVSGIGDVIRRAPSMPPAWLLLVNPGVPLDTGQVFAGRQGAFSSMRDWPDDLTDLNSLVAALGQRRNDLEPIAQALVPQIASVLDRLRGAEGCLLARMSGSGPTCFGLFADRESVDVARSAIAENQPGWWLAAAPLLHGKLSKHWDD